MADRRYTREEVDAILGRALGAQKDEGGMSHDELVAAAREIGVKPEDIDRAAAEVAEGKRLERETVAYRRRQWKGFLSHFVSYALVIAFLVFVNLMTSGTLWVLWPAAGWGLGLAFHLFGLLVADPEKTRHKVARREERRRERERRERKRRELAENAEELGVIVTKGLASVIGAAAERIEKSSSQPPPAAAHVRVDAPTKAPKTKEQSQIEQDRAERERELAEAEAELEEELKGARGAAKPK
jgi:hypothetical protein